MLQILVPLLMILAITQQKEINLPKSFTNIECITNWTAETYEIINNKDETRSTSDIHEILQNVIQSSNKLNSLMERLGVKCNSILDLLLSGIIYEDIDIPEMSLCDNINKVNRFFKESRKYEEIERYSNKTLREFTHKVLWSDENLQDALEDLRISSISSKYSSGLLDFIYQHSMLNLIPYCGTHASIQQLVYHIYIQLIISELEGLLTLQQIYLTLRVLDKDEHDYVGELNYARTKFQSGVKNYYNGFTKAITSFSQLVRRCNVKKPQRGGNIIEMRNFARFRLLERIYPGHSGCDQCPPKKKIQEISRLSATTIYNCLELGYEIKICPAGHGSYRDYLWFKNNDVTFGHESSCEKVNEYSYGSSTSLDKSLQFMENKYCQICACSIVQNKSVDNNFGTTISRISVEDQIADLKHNMLVTGIKFSIHKNTLYFNIFQSNFSNDGLFSYYGNWKDFQDTSKSKNSVRVKSNMLYKSLNYNRRTIYLDDVKVPDGWAVIGVRFQLVENSAFELQLLGSRFDFQTGKLILSDKIWYSASKNPWRPKDYHRKRVEINLDNSDDPTRIENFEYDFTTNKKVDFTHTNIYKDAGQTTIPLLDAQLVYTKPPFPLSGIGLSFKGKKGFGGYIAPRIFTIDISKYMKTIHIQRTKP